MEGSFRQREQTEGEAKGADWPREAKGKGADRRGKVKTKGPD